jgi:tripartite-type tricarboxylate transporter receptor subunit TctC
MLWRRTFQEGNYLIAPSGPGSGGDVLSRLSPISCRSILNNQPVVVINNTGGGGIVAWEYMLSQPQDGLYLDDV